MLDLQVIAARLERRFGRSAHGWVRALPERVAALSAEWQLEVGPTFKSGSSSVVLRCTGPRGDAVLKLSPDLHGVGEEADMLRLFAGSGRVPAVLEATEGAVLLEVIDPGTLIDQHPCPAPAEYAEFLRDLHSVGNVERAPRQLEGWTDVLFASAAKRGADLDRARQLRDELLATQTRTVLLHGDLHFGNILHGGSRGLVAIDPMACAGDPCFDAVDYVLEGSDRAEMLRRRDELAKAADLDVDRLDAWCQVTAPVGATHVRPAHAAELLAFAHGERQ